MEPAGLTLSVVATFNACFQGYKLLCNIQNTSADVARLRCKFEIEQARFLVWGRSWGLIDRSGNLCSDESLETKVVAEGSPLSKLVSITLNEIASIMSDGTKLKRKYGFEGLEVEEGAARPPLINEGNSNDSRPSALRLAKRLSWTIRDQSSFQTLVSDLRQLNDGLYSLIPLRSQEHLMDALNAKILSTRVSSEELMVVEEACETTSSLGVAASLKAASIEAEKSTLSHNWSSSLSMKLPRQVIREVTGSDPSPNQDARTIAICQLRGSHEEQQVLVEWKAYDHRATGRMAFAIALRADGLARVLGKFSQVEGLRTLPCLGYIDDLEQARFGFIFQLPQPQFYGWPSAPVPLSCIIQSFPKLPALEDRFALASGLARTLFEFHCSGWLHRDFTPDSVMVSTSNGDSSRFDLTTPYILGFAYSRPEDHEGISSEARNENEDGYPILYHHPRLMSHEHPKLRFCRAFDVYALGCVLLEIGLWRRLTEFWKQRYTNDPERWSGRLRGLAGELQGRCGGTYSSVVKSCLDVDPITDAANANALVDFCWDVVGKIQSLQV